MLETGVDPRCWHCGDGCGVGRDNLHRSKDRALALSSPPLYSRRSAAYDSGRDLRAASIEPQALIRDILATRHILAIVAPNGHTVDILGERHFAGGAVARRRVFPGQTAGFAEQRDVGQRAVELLKTSVICVWKLSIEPRGKRNRSGGHIGDDAHIRINPQRCVGSVVRAGHLGLVIGMPAHKDAISVTRDADAGERSGAGNIMGFAYTARFTL